MFASDQAKATTHHRGNLQGELIPRWASMIAIPLLDLARCLHRRWLLCRMRRLEDHMLDDIGVTREELSWAIDLPLRVNAALALHDRARRRRAAVTGSP